jgi:hypothetical protein
VAGMTGVHHRVWFFIGWDGVSWFFAQTSLKPWFSWSQAPE